jgi:hypothetical protein
MDALKRTGYPLEVEVIDALMNKGWAVFPEYTYYDENTKKLRAIDALAYYSSFESLFSLLVECKTSRNPWIVHSLQTARPYSNLSLDGTLQPNVGVNMLSLSTMFLGIGSFAPLGALGRFKDHGAKLLEETQKLHFFTPELPKVYSCHELGKENKNEPDSFAKALYQIRGAFIELSSRDARMPKFASIVHSGELYEYGLDNSKPKIEPRKHVVFQTMSLSPGLLPNSEKKKPSFPLFFVDIVESSHFQSHLDTLQNDAVILNNMRRMLMKIT